MADQTEKPVQQFLKEMLERNRRLKESLGLAAPEPQKPKWKISPIQTDAETGKLKGGYPQVFLPGYKFPTTLKPANWLALFDPQVVQDGLKAMQANLNQHGEHGMRFRSREEFEAFQLRLEELIRMYENLI